MPDDSVPFLDSEPPHWAVRGLAYILITLFLTALIISIFVSIPETVLAPFVLVPLKGADPVRASAEGIVTSVQVSEGTMVGKGQPLFVIQSRPSGDRSAEMHT